PAFYVVAQTQHLPTASKRLHLSVSALSRTIRLLEAAVGRPLFHRTGRNLQLNAHGEGLLLAVERSIGVLAPEFDRLTANGFASALHIGIADPLSQGVVMPVVRSMQLEHSDFVPFLHGCVDGAEASKLLLTGDLDLVLSSERLSEKALAAESLGLRAPRMRTARVRQGCARPGTIACEEDAFRFGDSLLVRAEYAAAQRAYRAALRAPAGSARERAKYLLRRARISLMTAKYAA